MTTRCTWFVPRRFKGRRLTYLAGGLPGLLFGLADITPQLARESGFKGVVDLLKVAKHGPGENIFLVRFHYLPPDPARAAPTNSRAVQKPRRRAPAAGSTRRR